MDEPGDTEQWFEVREDPMKAESGGSLEQWAVRQFGMVDLGDIRRTKRATRLAEQMARHPAASLPDQTGCWAATKAGYRLFDCEEVTLEALQTQHWQQTRDLARVPALVLQIQDTSMLDFTTRKTVEGLGPIGDGNGRGFLLHTALAVDPADSGTVLGLSYQKLFCRQPTPDRETFTERKKRSKESDVWRDTVRLTGSPPENHRWVHVCDRYADNFEVMQACGQSHCHFLIRVAQNRRAALGHEASVQTGHLLMLARGLPAQGEKTLHVRRRPTRQPREARLLVAWSAVSIFPPWLERKTAEPVRAWVVRVWEADSPPDEAPIEWVLLTDVPVDNTETAKTIAHWYSLRWLVEEYYKCLKTGCRVEQRQMETAARLEACIGILAIVAVRLLQLKLVARATPDRPACECAPPEHVRVLAAYRGRSVEEFTAQVFWREVAKLGGFLGRRSDGDPGWQTLWRGWQKLDLMTIGANLTTEAKPRCG